MSVLNGKLIYLSSDLVLSQLVVGISMGTNCILRIDDLFSFCDERDSMASLSEDKQAEIIQPLNQQLDTRRSFIYKMYLRSLL